MRTRVTVMVMMTTHGGHTSHGDYNDSCHQSLHSIQRVADTSITLAELEGAGALGVIILKTTLFCHLFFFLFICLNR